MRSLTLAILISIVALSSMNTYAFPIKITPTNGSGHIQPLTAFAYSFVFTNTTSCTPILLNTTTTITTDQYGDGFADLNLSNLTGTPSYLCEYRNATLRTIHDLRAIQNPLGYNITTELDSRYCQANGTNCPTPTVDTNNYTMSCSVTGTTTKTTTCSKNGGDNYTWTWTDLDTDTNTDDLSAISLNIGNWSSDKNQYSTTTQANTLYAPISTISDNTTWNQTLANTLYLGIAATATNSNQLGGQVASYFLNSTGGTYDNTTWNETRANTLYAPISTISDNTTWNQTLATTLYYLRTEGLLDNQTWNETKATALYAPISTISDNTTWNQTLANTLYLGIAATATNSNQLGGQVASYFLNSTGGTYDNTTWNQTKANTLYAPISTISYNNSWNETLADTLYYDINLNKQGFYNSSTLPASLGINSGGWLNTTSLVSLANNNTNVSIGSLNSLPVIFVDNTNGYVGFGTSAMTSTNHWYFNSSADANKVLLINNGNIAGLSTAAVLRVQTAGAVLNFQAHGPSRTISRWGVTLANWSEFLSNSPSDGLAIGTTVGPLILGTTSIAAIYINETTQNIGFGATTTNEKLTVTGNISTTSSVIVGGGVLRLPSSASAPSDTTDGGCYYDTTNNDDVCCRVNGAWKPMTNISSTTGGPYTCA